MQGNGGSQLSPAEGLAHTCLLDLKLVWNSPWGVGGAGVGERRNTLLQSTDFLPDWEGSPSLSLCPSLSRSKFRLSPVFQLCHLRQYYESLLFALHVYKMGSLTP